MKNRLLAGKCAFLVLLSACSFTLAKLDEPYRPDVEDPPGKYCDTDRAKPVMDTTASVAFMALFLRGELGGQVDCDAGDSRCIDDRRAYRPWEVAVATGLLGAAAIYGVAALVGFDRTGRCRNAIRGYQAAVEADSAKRQAVTPRAFGTNRPPGKTMRRQAVAAPSPPRALSRSYSVHIIVPACVDGRRGVRILLGDPATDHPCAMDDGAPLVDLEVAGAADIVAPASIDLDLATVCPGGAEPCYTFDDASVQFDTFDAGMATGSFTTGTGSHQLQGAFSATWCTPVPSPDC